LPNAHESLQAQHEYFAETLVAAVYVSFWPTKERAAGKGAVEQVLPGRAERVGGLVGWMAEKGACRDLQQTLAKNTKRGDQLSAAFGCSAKSVFGVWRGDTRPEKKRRTW